MTQTSGGHPQTRRGFLRAAGLALGGLAVAGVTPLGVRQAEAAGLHTYLGNYPESISTGWTEDIQGVTHDDKYWFISQTAALWRIPMGYDLGRTVGGTDATRDILRVGMPKLLTNVGYDHFGDIDYYGGYLFVPLERTGDREITPAVAVFRANTLRYLGYDDLPPQPRLQGASWCAVNPSTGVLHSSCGTIGERTRTGTIGRMYRYQVDLARVAAGAGFLGKPATSPLCDESGRPLSLEGIQGGAFRPDGQRLYVQADGIHVFDSSYRRIGHSTNGSGSFNYEFHTGDHEEPEALTYWDLNDGRAPNIRGVLHALMLDNDGWSSGEVTTGADDLYFKHYR